MISALRRAVVPPTSTRRKLPRPRIETLEPRDVPAAFTSGNLVVLRVGDGTSTRRGKGSSRRVARVHSWRAAVQTIPAASSGGNALTISGNANTEGFFHAPPMVAF